MSAKEPCLDHPIDLQFNTPGVLQDPFAELGRHTFGRDQTPSPVIDLVDKYTRCRIEKHGEPQEIFITQICSPRCFVVVENLTCFVVTF